jgi:ribosomal protein S27E
VKETDYGLRMNELRVQCLLCADDQVILSSSAKELQVIVTIMNEALTEEE